MSDELNDFQLNEVCGGSGQRFVYHTVVHGDNLTRISHWYKTSIQVIMNLNPIITNPNFVRPGWVLKVPNNL